MSVKEDWRRKQTVSDAEMEDNWKQIFGDNETIEETNENTKRPTGT